MRREQHDEGIDIARGNEGVFSSLSFNERGPELQLRYYEDEDEYPPHSGSYFGPRNGIAPV